MAKDVENSGIFSATYSGIPVFEFQFGADLKEHVMRRRHDDWINATHILKAAGFDKPARTRILEREVQKDVHEKIQGGYGKYQGTWIPLEHGSALAQRNNIYDRLRPIFEYVAGDVSPPPAPRHASKPKAPRARPAVPKWTAPQPAPPPPPPPPAPIPEEFEPTEVTMNEDDTPDNLTVASVSYAADDDHEMSSFSVPQRKRKREEAMQDLTEQQHSVYGDELLDYFLLSRNEQPAIRPDPPTNFQPNWVIDTERHTALHWACAMGDVEVVKQLKRFGATLGVQNDRGETPFMRAVSFTNCFEKQTFPAIIKELFETVDARDHAGCTIIHHAAVMKSGRVTSQSCARYYLDNILNRLQDTHDPNFVQQLIDAQDHEGNTAVHLAAKKHATKCIRALLGRGASTDIPNNEGIRAEDMIKELNATKKARAPPQRSSSPFAPDSQRRLTFMDSFADVQKKAAVHYQSDAAVTVQSRITQLVLEKFQDLAQSYEEEFKDTAEAEKEAGRILGNTQGELSAIRAEIADLEARMEPDEVAANIIEDAKSSRSQLLSLVHRRNRVLAQSDADSELAVLISNGQGGSEELNGINGINGMGGMNGISGMNGLNGLNELNELGGLHGGSESALDGGVREELALELHQLALEQRQAEADYVDALAAVGTSDKIEKYRRLLRSCLGPEADSLEENLDDMIAMMEEEVSDSIRHEGRESMEIAAM